MTEQFIGGDFDDFLTEEGILASVEAIAIKRVIALQLVQLMEERKLSKAEMARQMNTSRAVLYRLLDPANPSVTLQTLERAASVLGKRIQINLV